MYLNPGRKHSACKILLLSGCICTILSSFFFSLPLIPLVNSIPQSQSGTNSYDLTLLNYSLDYYYKDDEKIYDESIKFNLKVNGTDRIYENGTIQYFLPDGNITDSTLLEKLELIFTVEQIEYFSNHSQNEYYQTYFQQRNETTNIEPLSNFNDEAQYLVFWLNSTENGPNYLRSYRIIRFFDVKHPFNLAIDDEFPQLAAGSWDGDKSDLRRPVEIINTYHLYIESNGVTIDLYYDQKYAILLHAKIRYSADKEEFSLDLRLAENNLSLDLLSDNPHWIKFRNQLIIGTSTGIVVILGGIFVLRKKLQNLEKKPKKKSILDQI